MKMGITSSNDFAVVRDQHTVTIRIMRASKKNSLTLSMWTELGDLYASFSREAEVRSIILCGDGGTFSAGGDISEFGTVRATEEQARAYEVQVDRCLDEIATARQTTIAAISGACMGGGFALAQACDFRLADHTAYFSIPAVQMGLVYGIIKCQRLVSTVGLTNARLILLTGKRIDAAAAKDLGFVMNVTNGDVTESALTFARDMELSAPLATAGMKSILDAIVLGQISERRKKLEEMIDGAAKSSDHREAVQAFAERRPAKFTGQ